MIKKCLKLIRVILQIVLFCGMIFFLFNIAKYYKIEKKENVEEFFETRILYGNEKCYLKNDILYVINKSRGEMHIFDKNGDFKKGFQLPTVGGDLWIGVNDKLYIYSVRKHLMIEMCGTKIEGQSNVYYNSPNEFYNSHNLTDKKSLLLKKNIVYLLDDSKEEIFLKVKTSTLSISVCIVLYIVCFFAFLFTTGLFSKLTNTSRQKRTTDCRIIKQV